MGFAVHSYRIEPQAHPPVMEMLIEESSAGKRFLLDVISAAPRVFGAFSNVRDQMMYINITVTNVSSEQPI
jgi:hypothetical protein